MIIIKKPLITKYTVIVMRRELRPDRKYKIIIHPNDRRFDGNVVLKLENECFQDALRCSQKRLLKVSRDRTFLLDRLKKMEASAASQNVSTSSSVKGANTIKRKRATVPKKPANASQLHQSTSSMLSKASPALGFGLSAGDGHMTPEEVERHLQSRQSYMELLPERAPPTVPTEMFSNDPSLDSESNDVLENSPNVEEWFD
ncbi:hypothetical protein HF086_007974 [Spodoptera exigua]|uniref:INO80 complex subunit E N-terminal domain-containing protein n=1 Tax=Spodoptera exigua TaxID=7107 RepID=A0A922MYB5_SPOEX|nr:hypothetical protein HF086_007974 [Spodoptera exigua]